MLYFSKTYDPVPTLCDHATKTGLNGLNCVPRLEIHHVRIVSSFGREDFQTRCTTCQRTSSILIQRTDSTLEPFPSTFLLHPKFRRASPRRVILKISLKQLKGVSRLPVRRLTHPHNSLQSLLLLSFRHRHPCLPLVEVNVSVKHRINTVSLPKYLVSLVTRLHYPIRCLSKKQCLGLTETNGFLP